MVSDTAAAVVKSPSDKRAYEALRLPNGLSALLIHDPEIKSSSAPRYPLSDASGDDDEDGSEVDDDDDDDESEEEEENEDDDDDVEAADLESSAKKKKRGHIKKAAAALCVSVGSYSDPKDAEGLAHFLEHMLFMGSTKFPDENEYDLFLAEHGGASNAFTDMEHTAYHFDVNHLHLKPALDRFSQFFVSPLIKIDSLEREVQAVDSEFVQSLQNDSVRLNQLKCSTADASHPYNRFSWGNEKSLTDAITKCGDIRKKLVSFYRQHYRANRMKLVVLGGEPLDTLRGWVSELFQDVPEGTGKEPVFWSDKCAWPSGKLYRVESVKDQHSLVITWPLPCLDQEYLKRPHDYISHLVGHEGSGSLLKLLKDKGWALDLSAGVGEDGFERSTAGYLFTVDIKLTLLGLAKVYEIIGHLYEYVKMLQDKRPQEWVFEELHAVLSMDFQYAEEESPDDYAANLAKNMHLYPVQHIIYGDYAFNLWDPKLVDSVLGHMNPGNMRVDVVSKSFDANAPGVLCEPWFGVHYTVEELPQHFLDSWSDPVLNPALQLPAANDFISREFSIRQSQETQDSPTILSEDPSMKVWYKLDQTFERPKANVYVTISCKMDNACSEVLTQLYVMLLMDAMNEIRYMASVASLSSSISSSIYSIEIKLQGYNEKLRALMAKFAEFFKTFSVKDDRFEVMKEHLGRAYRNANLKPLAHSSALRLEILLEPCWSSEEKLKCLSSIHVEDVKQFIPQLFDEVHIEALCHGNLTKEEALDVVNVLKTAVVTKPIPEHSRPKRLTLKLPTNAALVYNAHVVNELEENSVAEEYFQIEHDNGVASLQDRALVDLFEQVVHEPFFNQLRTGEQLGYRVDCGPRLTNGVIGFCFRIQSSKYNPEYLHQRIGAFIDRLLVLLKNMPSDVFQSHKDSLIAEKLEKDTCLSDETDRYWEHVLDQRYLFEEPKRVAMLLKDLTKEQLVTWYKNYIRGGGPMRRSLCIHIWGCKFRDELLLKKSKKQKKKPAYTTIEKIEDYKAKAEFYPPFKP